MRELFESRLKTAIEHCQAALDQDADPVAVLGRLALARDALDAAGQQAVLAAELSVRPGVPVADLVRKPR